MTDQHAPKTTLDNLPPLRAVLAQHGIVTRKKLGQHFLFDLNLTRRIAAGAGDLTGVNVIEISGRSQNFRIDRMHFYLGNVSNPLSLGKPQSSSVRGSAGTSDDWVLLLTR